MIRFEYKNTDDYEQIRKVIIEDEQAETIDDYVDNFVKFLKTVSFPYASIIKGLLEAVDNIKYDISEDYIMNVEEEKEEE